MITFLLSILSFLYCYILLRRFIHASYMFQLEHYNLGKLIDWYYKNKTNKKIYIPLLISILSLIMFFVLDFDIYLIIFELVLGILTIPFINYKQEKKRLNVTNRIKRFIAANLLIMLIIFLITYLICNKYYYLMEMVFINILILNFIIIDIIFLAALLVKPFEKLIQKKFINQARTKIILNRRLTTLGITGSYGKTSTKYIINQVLTKEYNVCMTPNSYNTPMGVTLSINNYLRNIDEMFICEMGACRVGEIKELCDIVFPKIGIITSIGPQHLDSFLNMKNIIKTKFELLESLPYDGLAILNYDNYYIRSYNLKSKVKILTYGIEKENVDYHAMNIHYGINGSTFEVVYPNKQRYLFKTKLLGKHNISNILASIALANHLDINIKKVINAIELLKPVSHRLELRNFNNYNIIDDSFNANIEGCRNALDILNHFENKKIIITPGMIEQGHSQYENNYQFGEKISKICDYVVLVGKNQTKPIVDALLDCNYPKDQIYITNIFNEGFRYILDKFREDFSVLIENDLPDNYNES